jgi:hypothetical protein
MRPSRHSFWILVALGVAMRVGVLLGSQRWLHWDECIIGLAAKEIFHVYFPGQAYGGGAGIESLVIGLLYIPFGMSAAVVKAYALVVSAGTMVVLGLFVRRVWGWAAAHWAVALWVTAPGLAVFSLQVRAGYIEIQLLAVVLLWLCHQTAVRSGAGPGRFIAFGLVAGLAYYTFALTLPLLLSVAVVILVWDKLCLTRPRWLGCLGGVALGLMPMILYDLTHGFAHVQWVLGQRATSAGVSPERLWRVVSFELPSFFQHDVDDYLAVVPWHAWVLGALTAVLVGWWIRHARADLRATVRQVPRRSVETPWPAGLHSTLVLFVAAYLAFYFLGPPRSPRYFIGLYPMLAIGMGVAVAEVYETKARVLRFAVSGAAGLLVVGGLVVNLHLMNLPGLRDVLGAPHLREGRVSVEPGGILTVRDWLLARDIRHVYSHPIIKWKLMFYSDEAIRGASVLSTYRDDGKHLDNLRKMDAAHSEGRPYALVFHHDFGYQGVDGGWVGVVGDVAIPGSHPGFVVQAMRALRPPPGTPASLVPYRDYVENALREAGIEWQTTRLGDYLVLHDFTGGSPVQVLLERFAAYFRMQVRSPANTPR